MAYKKKKAKKIFARLDRDAYERLTHIMKEYNFRSEYQILQYIVAAFLRVADPENDPEKDEPLQDEIIDMFSDLSQAERHFEFVKPKRKIPQSKIDEANGQLRIWRD